MDFNLKLCFFVIIMIKISVVDCAKKPIAYNQSKPNSKFDNPNFVRDRFKKIIIKPQMPEWWKNKNRTRTHFNPAWMDYCDPYHCNDYHKTACGLNRKTMRFKWFQSGCHIILNNMCATYRGFLKYDMIATKFCAKYVMFLRANCGGCEDEVYSPVCATSIRDQHIVLFKNKCALLRANCEVESLDDYVETDLNVCVLGQIYGEEYSATPRI